jgi:hypothetical protein
MQQFGPAYLHGLCPIVFNDKRTWLDLADEVRANLTYIQNTPFLVPREQDDHLFLTTISGNPVFE